MIEIELNSAQWLSLNDLPNEEWKDIKGYECLYEISNYGRVKSLEKRHINMGRNKATTIQKEHIMKSAHGTKGYIITTLTKHNKCRTLRNHRLVAQAFIPNPNNLSEVNHKDENKENNRVDNLEWCNTIYNLQYTI